MCLDDVTATLDLAPSASCLDRITVVHRAGKLLDRDAAMQNRIDLIKKYGGLGDAAGLEGIPTAQPPKEGRNFEQRGSLVQRGLCRFWKKI